MEFNKENWNDCLESLGFREIENPNGKDCYDVLDDRGIPIWQYDTEEKKEKLFYFFSGAAYWKIHTM